MNEAQRLPGDPTPRDQVERIIRVDHAGEYGAARIYAGQLAILRRSDKAALLEHMRDQEQQHLDRFSELVVRRRVRPTAMLPIWHLAGFALGAMTAALGQRAAMACTAAVEETIDAHYSGQIAELDEAEAELRDDLTDYGAGYSPSETPRGLAARVTADSSLDADEQLRRLTMAAERASYSALPVSGVSLRADSTAVRRALAASASRRSRWHARLFPPSVITPVAAALSQAGGALGRLGLSGSVLPSRGKAR